MRGATLFKYTGCGACEGGHDRNFFPVFFRSFRHTFGCFFGNFRSGGCPGNLWGHPLAAGGVPRSLWEEFLSFHCLVLGSFGDPSDDLFTVFSGLFSGARFLGARGDVLTRKVPEKVPR